MHTSASGSASAAAVPAAAAPARTDREATLREYFKSREVYRSERGGAILVDAFRFVNHATPFAPGTVQAEPQQQRPMSAVPESKFDLTSVAVKDEDTSAPTATPRTSPGHTFYFLSHFHSDHYTGITNRWHDSVIYCSRPTATLTYSQLGVPASCLFPMDLLQTYIFSLTTGACLDCVVETPQHPRVQALLRASSSSDAAADLFAVRLIPANHCPGAVMFLLASLAFGTVLHTGDFRFNGSREEWQRNLKSRRTRRTLVSPLLCSPQHQEQHQEQQSTAGSGEVPVPFYEQFIADDPALQEVAQQQVLDVLFLDNTFCSPAYRFPSQWEVTQSVVDVLRSLFIRAAQRATHTAPQQQLQEQQQRRQVRCAVLIGTYTIGKERVSLALQEAFPPAAAGSTAPWPVHVSPKRHTLLSAMGFFADSFAPMRASAASPVSLGDNATSAPVRLVDVEDTPVLLPVVHGMPTRLHGDLPRSSDGAVDSTGEDADLPATSPGSSPSVRRTLNTDFDAPESDGDGDSDDSPADRDVEYLLSVFLVSLSSVGYTTVAALASGSGPTAVAVGDDDLAVNLDRYDQVLLVEPTGWCKRCKTRDVTPRHTLLQVPYSEHCGFHEMLQFVQFVNPARIVPTVSEESFRSHEALFVERAPRLRSRLSNVQPITRFFPVLPLKKADVSSRGTPADGHMAHPPVSSASLDAKPTPAPPAPTAAPRGVPSIDPPAPETDRKRMRRSTASATAAPAAAAEAATAAASTLQRLFQKVKQEAPSGAQERPLVSKADAGEDEDCQVVRVVQAVVEISDSD